MVVAMKPTKAQRAALERLLEEPRTPGELYEPIKAATAKVLIQRGWAQRLLHTPGYSVGGLTSITEAGKQVLVAKT